MKGRKPKPTELKKLAGNPGGRPISELEPKPRRVKPRCPGWLSPEAKREWRRMTPKLFNLGLLTEIDGPAFAMYCVLWARWVKVEQQLQRSDLVILTSNFNLIQNPLVGISNRAMSEMLKILAEFGMSPSSRSRIKVSPDEGEKSLAEVLFESVDE